MASNTIDAKLRIAAEVQQAIAALKQLRKELVDTGKDAATAARGTSPTSAADPAVQAVRKRTAAERTAAAESAALARQQASADRAAAREAKRLADEQARRQRQQAAEEKRRLAEIEAAEKKAARFKANQGAQLAPQLNDIFVGLTTGQSPLQVALQQGPQITQIYGGVANTFRAVLSVLTPMRVALGGVALGFVAAAAGIASGYRESSRLRKELALTGNAADYSAGRIDALAQNIATSQGTAIGTVRDAATAVRQLAGQTNSTLESTTRAATILARLSGQSAEEAVSAFKDQAAGITDWSIKSNRAYNFLGAEQVRYVRSLERQGRVAEAIKFVNEQLADTLERRSVPAIGSLERAWMAAGRAISYVGELLKSIGRDDTTEERIDRLKRKLKELDDLEKARAGGRPAGERPAFFDAGSTGGLNRKLILDELEALREKQVLERRQGEIYAEQQARIKRESAELQALIAGTSAAAAQRALAAREAALSAEGEKVERAYAQEVESAFTRAQKLNAIDQARAAAQRDAVARQIEIQRGLADSLKTPEEVKQQETRLLELEAQFIAAKSRVATAISEGKRLVDAEVKRLDQDVAKRRAENELNSLPQVESDPFRRAVQEAAARTQQARAELADLRRQQAAALATPANPEVAAKLDQQIKAAQEALNETTRRNIVESLLQQSQEQLQLLQAEEAALADAVERGALKVEDAERRKIAARRAALPLLEQISRQTQQLAAGPAESNAVAEIRLRVAAYKDLRTELEKTTRSEGINALTGLLNNLTNGAKTLKEALRDAVGSFARAMLDVLNRRLAEALVDNFISAAQALSRNLFASNVATSATASPGFFASLGNFFAGLFHTGGVIGAGGARAATAVSPLVFAGAQVLHSGGIAGASLPMYQGKRQVPIIALEGEEMLTEDDPRHRNNYRGGAMVQYAPNISITGAQGNNEELARAGQDLDRRMRGAMDSWAAENMRPGGILAGRR